MIPRFRRIVRWLVLGLGIGLPLLLLFCNLWLFWEARGRLFSDLSLVPKRPTALLLGTSKFLKNGEVNLYYRYRIQAAIALWRAGKFERLILSGSGSDPKNNEPQQMAEDLIAAGLPASCLLQDPEGHRTILSAIECKKTFACSSVLLISQAFHNPRAVFLFRRLKIDAIAYNAQGVPLLFDPKTPVREIFARLWAFFERFFLRSLEKP